MKKILFSLFIFVSMLAKGQDPVPSDTAYHHLPTYSFKYYTKDSSVWIQKGAKYGTTKLVSNKRLKFLIDSINGNYLRLNQTVPQSVVNGSPIMEGIQFDTTPTTTNAAEGLLRWNATDNTLDLGVRNGLSTQQLGQETTLPAYNLTGSAIAEGVPVYITGRHGTMASIAPARSDLEATSGVFGVTTTTFSNTGDLREGLVTTFGYVRGIKTNYTGSGVWGTTWAENDKLYVSKTVAGQLTNVEPATPHHSDVVATVAIVHGTLGSILVLNEKHKDLQNLSDVNGTALTHDGQFPVWDNTNKFFDFTKDANGLSVYHGIQTMGALSFDNSTHVFTVAAGGLTYWNQGQKYTSTAAKTVDVDDATLVTNKLYFIYWSDTTGVLRVSQTPWDWYAHTFVATLYWNGSEGAIQDEDHDYRRNVAWQKWAHTTIGTRYGAGLSLIAPTAAADATLSVGSGTIYDEDHEITISSQSTMRGWYKVSANVMTYANYSLPYLGTSGAPVFLDTDTYSLATFPANRFAVYWVYASNDQDRPIYVIPTQASTTYTTLALARAETAPDLSLIPINSEMKIIYRYIFTGDGEFQEFTDYRGSSPLPAGGSSSTTAGAVSFSPYGNISSTTVQTALQELDDEKKAKNDSILNSGYATQFDLSSYKLKNDSVVNSGYYTNYKASILNNLANDTWTRVYDYAGNLSNMWKLSKDNVIEPAFPLGINSLYFVRNQGINEIVSIPLSTASATGTEHGVEMTVGTNKIMKVSAKVSATGTADTARVTLSTGTKLGVGKQYSSASVDIEGGTTTRPPLKLTSGDTLTTKMAGAIEFKGDTYYGTITTGTERRQFAFLQDPHFKDSITVPVLKVLDGKGLGKILVSDAAGKLTYSNYTQGLMKTSSTGAISILAHGDAGKYLQSNGATADPTWVTIVTSSGDFLDAVLGMQQDATLNPTLTTGNRYIILDAANLHANFGTINKNMAGGALTLGNGDIVQYTGSEFRIAFDASAATTNVTVLVTLDKNGASSHDWTYNVDTDNWVDRGSGTLHNSLSDLNTGAGTYYHLTQAQYTSQPLIKSDTTSLVATKTNIALYKLKNDSTANSGYASVWDVSQKRALNDHDSLSTLQERSYNSLTDKPTLYSGTVTSVATGLGLTGGTITTTGTLSLDTASTVVLSRQRAANTYVVKNDSSKLYERIANKVTSISGSSTDIEYPTAKLLYDQLLQKRSLNDHDSLSTLQEKNYSSLDGKPDLTVYRLLNNHDSLSTLQEKNYSSLDGKPDLSVYRLLNNHDSLSTLQERSYNSLTDKPTLTSFVLPNDTWIPVVNYAADTSNFWKLSKDNIITPAYTVGLNSLFHVRNSGYNNIVSIPLDASGTGVYHGVGFNIGGTDVLKIRGYGNSSGGIDSARVIAPRFQMTDSLGVRKIIMGRSDGLMRWSTSQYLDTLDAYRLLIPTAQNTLGQLAEGTTGKILRGVTGGLPVWSTPTYPNTATSGKVLIGDGTNIVLSTPTFPNASATFGKIIKSDGTNWVASTETYAAPGTSGNAMISNGTNWTSAPIPDIYWTGTATNLVAATGRTSLGGTTIGQSIFTLTNPSAITFLRINADNTASALSASDFRTAIGSGTVTSITANSGLLGGTITTTGTISVDTTYVLKKTTAASMYQPKSVVLTNIQDSLNLHEHIANKVTSISGSSTNTQYPSAKLLYDQLLQKRALNDHDSLSTLQEKSYNSLTDRPDLSVYKLNNDSVNNSGYHTNWDSRVQDITTNATYYPLFTNSTSGQYLAYVGSGKLSFNPSTGVMVSTNFQLSDRRLKQNILPLSEYDFMKIRSIELLKFTMRDDPTNKIHFGAIAQDVEKIYPEFVNTDDKGTKSVNYTELLLAKIADLENRIKELEKNTKKKWRAKQCVIDLP